MPEPKGKKYRGQRRFHTKIDREHHKTVAVKLLRQGVPMRVIARQLNVDQEWVRTLRDETMASYAAIRSKERDILVETQLAILEEVRLKALIGWRRSLSPKERKIKEWMPMVEEIDRKEKAAKGKAQKIDPSKKNLKAAPIAPVMRLIKAVHQKEGRLPGNEYLKTIIDTVAEEAKLLGLYVDIHFDTRNYLHVDWNEMRQLRAPSDPLAELEAQLVSDKPAAPKQSKNGVHHEEEAE